MKFLFSVFVALLVLGASANVIQLDSATFESSLKEHKLAAVLFKDSSVQSDETDELMSAFEESQPQLDALNPPVKLATFNVNEDSHLKMKYGIFKTPQVKMFKNGNEIHRPFNGGSSSDTIVAYLTRHSETPSIEVKTLEEAQQYVPTKDGGSSTVVIFGFFKKVDMDFNALLAIEEEVRDMDHIVCIHGSADEIMQFYGQRHTFVIYHPTRLPAVWNTQNGISEFEGLRFIANHSTLDVDFYNDNTKLLYDRVDRPIFKVYVDTDEERNHAQLKYLHRRLTPLAAQFPNIRFTIADFGRYATVARDLDYGPDEVREGAAIIVTQQQLKWRPVGMHRFDVSAVEEFLVKFTAHQIKPYLRSDVLPANAGHVKPGMGLVHEVVGLNFYEVVMDSKTDVLVVLYAPWCGHCKTLLPTLDDVAAALKGDRSIVIAKIDATSNGSPVPFKATAYPTILFGRREEKVGTAIPFEGERTKENLLSFIKQNRSPK